MTDGPRLDGRDGLRAHLIAMRAKPLIRLTVYREARAVAAATLALRRAVALAGELIAAALPKLRAP
jgi:hypothetical protein